MNSKIKSVTIITSARNITYTVGETYNSLALHEIKNHTIEMPDAIYTEFTGYTAEGLSVFSAVGPVALHVQYEPSED